jgi:glycerophosphoryl diester phosphodiesterase
MSWWAILLYTLAAITLWCLLAHCIFMRICTCRKRPIKIRQWALNHETKRGWLLNGAHRGGSSERAENTTDAFRHAMSLGLNLMECDVHLSKDGEVVVAHDSTLERMCGPEYAGKRVSDFNFADLPRF